MKKFKGILYTIVSSIAFGIQPLLATSIYAYGVSPKMLSLLRPLLMVPIFAVVVALDQNSTFRIKPKALLQTWFLAVTGAVLTTVMLYDSYRYIDTGMSTTLNFTYPVFVFLMSVILCKEKPSGRLLLCLIICTIGVVLFCDLNGDFSWKGFLLALGSGLFYGIYVLYLDKSHVLERTGFFTYTFYFFLLTTLCLLPLVAAKGELRFNLPLSAWGKIIIFALLSGIVASVLHQAGIAAIGSKKSSILGAMEPTTSVVLGILFLNESTKLRSILGILLVLAATTYLIAGESKEN